MNMKYLIHSILFVFLFTTNSCIIRNNTPPDKPVWLKQKIRKLSHQPVQNPPASVYEYQYNGDIVFYFPPQCCDAFSDLFDKNGKLICHPDGGITGKGDGLCSDFFQQATMIQLIWQDKRH